MAEASKSNQWQFNKSIAERNEHMLEKELASDVSFMVSSSQSDKPRLMKAHKYMLISASPVFWTMLCGEMKADGNIIVSDVEPDAFMEMLRFIYCENVTLSGSNVMQVLNAAKKYQLPALEGKCVEFLDDNLIVDNVLPILEHSLFFDEPELSEKCFDLIERRTELVFSSQEFLAIKQETLTAILERDNLALDEVELFQRCCEWATRNKKSNQLVRDILGRALYKIRFRTMSASNFADVVCKTGILTTDEQSDVFVYITSSDKSKTSKYFSTVQRTLHKDTGRSFKMGDRVKVKKNVDKLKTSWGDFTHDSVGLVKNVDGIVLHVDFPRQKNWGIIADELDLVS